MLVEKWLVVVMLISRLLRWKLFGGRQWSFTRRSKIFSPTAFGKPLIIGINKKLGSTRHTLLQHKTSFTVISTDKAVWFPQGGIHQYTCEREPSRAASKFMISMGIVKGELISLNNYYMIFKLLFINRWNFENRMIYANKQESRLSIYLQHLIRWQFWVYTAFLLEKLSC